MLKKDIIIGQTYTAKVSDKLATVRITSTSIYGGWNAVNTATGREVRIKTAGRLRKPVSMTVSPDVAARLTQLIGYPPENS